MQYKICKFAHSSQDVLLKHTRLRHGGGVGIGIVFMITVFAPLKPKVHSNHILQEHTTEAENIKKI